MYQRENNIIRLSGWTGLILIIFSCIITIFSVSFYAHALFTIWLFILFMYFGFGKQGFMYLMVYFITLCWLVKLVPLGVSFPAPMLLGMLYKFIVPVMASYLTAKIPSGKVIEIFQKLPIHQNIKLILIVMMRFAPTVIGEFRAVREAMKVRGFIGDFKKVLSHPLRTLEYAIVPIIFRSIKVGDEIAAASIVRGVENPCKKESYYTNRLNNVDYVTLIMSLFIGTLAVIY